MNLSTLETPALILDRTRLDHNLARMHAHLAQHGVGLRPHVKTAKSINVVRRAMEGERGGITVSTLAEAEYFLQCGLTDILYAVGVAPNKLAHIADLHRRGADITLVLDSAEAAAALAAGAAQHEVVFPALIEIDSDGHRSGVRPGDSRLIEIGKTLAAARGTELRGVMTHAGDSYNCKTIDAIRAMAERERGAVVQCAEALQRAGLPCPVVSVGSTPTATFGDDFSGVTEVRAGVYMFFDLVMAGLGVCTLDDIAVSVLTTVIGHQADKGWIITDAGWMALSRDRGTAKQAIDQGYGVVCDLAGKPIEELIVADTNQEHGIIARRDGGRLDVARFPLGTPLRILPNHACATAAQHARYHVVGGATAIETVWPRMGGW